ncbi:MAG: NAD-dependent epimerase/dehydratase family protein [Bacteroidales bacterium]|nr:NAD-dependent epimerase/dehydratase family protein [Bacteroidales bacterium]
MVLVTGGTGLIGSHLLYELALQHNNITAIKRPQGNIQRVLKIFGYYSDRARELFDKITWVDAGLNDIASLEPVFKGAGMVYHCAGMVNFDRSQKKILYETNVEGTANIVNQCLESGVKKLCFVSSIASLGEYDGFNPVDENTKWKPGKKSGVYALSKFKAELEVWRGIAEGLNCIVVHPSVVIGPGFPDSALGKMLGRVKKGMSYYTLGSTGYVDVRDVARIMVMLMQSDISGEQFLVSSENLKFKEVLDIISEILGKKKPSIYASPFLTNLARIAGSLVSAFTGTTPAITKDSAKIAHKTFYYSSEKVKKTLDYNFIPVRESLRFTIEKYLAEFKEK